VADCRALLPPTHETIFLGEVEVERPHKRRISQSCRCKRCSIRAFRHMGFWLYEKREAVGYSPESLRIPKMSKNDGYKWRAFFGLSRLHLSETQIWPQ